MRNIKYLSSGQEVEVLETTPSGVIVRYLYEHDDFDSDPIVVNRVHDEPPAYRFAESVTKQEVQLEILRSQVAAARSDLAVAKAKKLELDKLVTTTNNVEALNRIGDFINGKITHFVRGNEFGDIQIVEYSEHMKQNCNGNSIRLLCLFGDSNGDLQWKINKWHDGSGAVDDAVGRDRSCGRCHDAGERIFGLERVGLRGACYPDSAGAVLRRNQVER